MRAAFLRMQLPPEAAERLIQDYKSALILNTTIGEMLVADPDNPDGTPKKLTTPADINAYVFNQTMNSAPIVAARLQRDEDYARRASMIQAYIEREIPGLLSPQFFNYGSQDRERETNYLRGIPMALAYEARADRQRSMANEIDNYERMALYQSLGLTGNQQSQSTADEDLRTALGP
jgi:hypothetical protein